MSFRPFQEAREPGFRQPTKAKARRVRRFFRQGKWADVIDLTDSIVEKTAVQLRREMVDPGTSGPGPKRAPVVLSDNAKAFERGAELASGMP